MKFTIEITCDNAAFHPFDGQEIRRILSKLGRILPDEMSDMADQAGEVYRTLADINGNRVGHFEVQGFSDDEVHECYECGEECNDEYKDDCGEVVCEDCDIQFCKEAQA